MCALHVPAVLDDGGTSFEQSHCVQWAMRQVTSDFRLPHEAMNRVQEICVCDYLETFNKSCSGSKPLHGWSEFLNRVVPSESVCWWCGGDSRAVRSGVWFCGCFHILGSRRTRAGTASSQSVPCRGVFPSTLPRDGCC